MLDSVYLPFFVLRLVASLFLNLCLMRNALSRANNAGCFVTLSGKNVEQLRRSAFLFRSAHNSCRDF